MFSLINTCLTSQIVMRISRKKRPKKLLVPEYNINHKIQADEVRVLDADNQNLGIHPLEKAVQMAEEEGLDLVEINPKANPPVAQIMEYSQFKYQKEKQARKQRQNVHVGEIKGIRLSMRIGAGDMETRRKQAEKFLERGDKVKIEIILRGAERYKTPLAFETVQTFTKMLEETMSIKWEQDATRQGNKITAIIVKQ